MLLLLQISKGFKCTENKHGELNFRHKFYLFTRLVMRVKYLAVAWSRPYWCRSIFWFGQSLCSILQLPTHLVNFSTWKFVCAISISSFFSFWKLDYFSDTTCSKPFIWQDFMFFLNSANQISLVYVMLGSYWRRTDSLNINSTPIREIPTVCVCMCVLHNLRKSVY